MSRVDEPLTVPVSMDCLGMIVAIARTQSRSELQYKCTEDALSKLAKLADGADNCFKIYSYPGLISSLIERLLISAQGHPFNSVLLHVPSVNILVALARDSQTRDRMMTNQQVIDALKIIITSPTDYSQHVQDGAATVLLFFVRVNINYLAVLWQSRRLLPQLMKHFTPEIASCEWDWIIKSIATMVAQPRAHIIGQDLVGSDKFVTALISAANARTDVTVQCDMLLLLRVFMGCSQIAPAAVKKIAAALEKFWLAADTSPAFKSHVAFTLITLSANHIDDPSLKNLLENKIMIDAIKGQLSSLGNKAKEFVLTQLIRIMKISATAKSKARQDSTLIDLLRGILLEPKNQLYAAMALDSLVSKHPANVALMTNTESLISTLKGVLLSAANNAANNKVKLVILVSLFHLNAIDDETGDALVKNMGLIRFIVSALSNIQNAMGIPYAQNAGILIQATLHKVLITLASQNSKNTTSLRKQMALISSLKKVILDLNTIESSDVQNVASVFNYLVRDYDAFAALKNDKELLTGIKELMGLEVCSEQSKTEIGDGLTLLGVYGGVSDASAKPASKKQRKANDSVDTDVVVNSLLFLSGSNAAVVSSAANEIPNATIAKQ
ncbi:MAG: hypothetical protein COB66_02755 [Coxiella sp. (in: Bacteria)]|nr:MAG: hypothetical protein COB66_02755 [Coxiella sp. (in: g-proteobacteria)]